MWKDPLDSLGQTYMGQWPRIVLIFATLFSGSLAKASLEILAREEGRPFNFMQNGKPVGLAVDVVNEIQHRLKTNEQIAIVPWARGYTILTASTRGTSAQTGHF